MSSEQSWNPSDEQLISPWQAASRTAIMTMYQKIIQLLTIVLIHQNGKEEGLPGKPIMTTWQIIRQRKYKKRQSGLPLRQLITSIAKLLFLSKTGLLRVGLGKGIVAKARQTSNIL